jgi:preprotein translocase subunit SecB
MKTSSLQLNCYFVTELNVSANRQHDPKAPITLSADNLTVKPDILAQNDDPRRWQVTLRIHQQGRPSTNSPYFFTIELVGMFSVAANYPEKQVESLVRTNASSVLYSTAREVLRSAMAQGPFFPLLLPTLSFYTPEINPIHGAATAAPSKRSGQPAKAAKAGRLHN